MITYTEEKCFTKEQVQQLFFFCRLGEWRVSGAIAQGAHAFSNGVDGVGWDAFGGAFACVG